jgi:hypothetical protein
MKTITVKQWPAGNGLPDFSVLKVDNAAVEVVAGNYRERPRVDSGNVVYARPELFPRPVKAAVFRALKELGHVS